MQLTPNHVYFAGLAVLLLFVGLEFARHPQRFRWWDSATNLLMYTGYLLVGLLWLDILFRIYYFFWQYRLFDFGPWWMDPTSYQFWLLWGGLFILEDLCFYLFHRGSHRWGLFWASHVTHHSSPHFNFTTALRQSWFPFLTFVFWLPLPLIGFDPLMVITMQLISLAYQAFLHTQTDMMPKWFGLVFNTATHHRIHHASNRDIVDRNFGGILIVWDRVFGTFASSEEEIEYGVRPAPTSFNPLWLQVHGWVAFFTGLIKRERKSV